MNDLEIEIHCPDCDAAMNVMLSQIAREEAVTCPGCKKVIHMKPDPTPEGKTAENPFDVINRAMHRFKEKS